MILIAYLNENLPDCNENLAWGKQEPLFNPAQLVQNKRSEVSQNFILHSFHVVIIKFKSIQY